MASLWGGVVALDTTALMQIMISRPIVACSVIGLILGNFPLGFLIGILSELLYVSELPVGAAKFAEGNVGATAAATIAILTTEQLPSRPYAAIACALFLLIIISSIGGRLVLVMRQVNGRIYEKLVYKESLSARDINIAQFYGIVLAFVLGFVTVFTCCALFAHGLPWALKLVPENNDIIFQSVQGSMLAVGCVFLAHHFWRQTQKKLIFILGLGLGMVLFISFL
ncbi:PTS sugar transporter subunit IIC [candidate division KSB1 bacterium]|nr:PTS sugar transporter subunit IIC [candidate division KSB1 bacterium]